MVGYKELKGLRREYWALNEEYKRAKWHAEILKNSKPALALKWAEKADTIAKDAEPIYHKLTTGGSRCPNCGKMSLRVRGFAIVWQWCSNPHCNFVRRVKSV